jgi:hypothetical protein
MSEVETGALGPGRIETRELEQEMRSSFLDYAMSVIVSRALPDVRDGLKPVHRRVLYATRTQTLNVRQLSPFLLLRSEAFRQTSSAENAKHFSRLRHLRSARPWRLTR